MEAIVPTKLGESAYQRISDAIIKGHFTPGQKVTIRALSNTLGISTTPIRDAVNRLIQEEALEQRSLRDVRVTTISESKYREIAAIRTELEGLAASRAAERITEGQLAFLMKIISQNESAIRHSSWGDATSLNQEFHFALADIAEMPVLRSILGSLWLKIGPLLAGYYQHGGRTMIDQHYIIVKALREGDPNRARLEIGRDINNPLEGIARFCSPG